MSGDEYRTVTAVFRGGTERAYFFDKPPARGAGRCTIPRSLLHGADDDWIQYVPHGEECTFRVRAWKAEEIGFA